MIIRRLCDNDHKQVKRESGVLDDVIIETPQVISGRHLMIEIIKGSLGKQNQKVAF